MKRVGEGTGNDFEEGWKETVMLVFVSYFLLLKECYGLTGQRKGKGIIVF